MCRPAGGRQPRRPGGPNSERERPGTCPRDADMDRVASNIRMSVLLVSESAARLGHGEGLEIKSVMPDPRKREGGEGLGGTQREGGGEGAGGGRGGGVGWSLPGKGGGRVDAERDPQRRRTG